MHAVIIGIPGAGAKAVAAHIVTGQFPATPEEAASALEWRKISRTFEKLALHVIGLGSQQALWRRHLPSAEALVFVIDGSREIDSDRLTGSLSIALKNSGLQDGVPILVLLNKADLVEDSIAQERKGLAAAAIGATCGAVRQCRICVVSARTGGGMDEATRVICGNTLTF